MHLMAEAPPSLKQRSVRDAAAQVQGLQAGALKLLERAVREASRRGCELPLWRCVKPVETQGPGFLVFPVSLAKAMNMGAGQTKLGGNPPFWGCLMERHMD